MAAAIEARTVLDISVQPALFGGQMRGTTATLMTIGGSQIALATDVGHAANLVQAHLIQTLSAVGRDWLDLYFLGVVEPVREDQLQGALEALESAREEGYVRYFGLAAFGDGDAALASWRLRDAFEVVLVDPTPQHEPLRQAAAERRCGVVTRGAGNPMLRTVRSALEIQQSMTLVGATA